MNRTEKHLAGRARSLPMSIMTAMIMAAAGRAGAETFKESAGVVAMEAENATVISGWAAVDIANSCGTAMEDRGNKAGKLEFSITFNKTGTYILWVRHEKKSVSEGCTADDRCNDCEVFMNNAPLFIYEGSACSGHAGDVIGFGTHETQLAWQSRPKTECSADRSGKHVATTIPTIGTHTLKIKSRSDGYRIDKIVMVHVDNGIAMPAGCGPDETVEGAVATTARRRGPATAAAMVRRLESGLMVDNIEGTGRLSVCTIQGRCLFSQEDVYAGRLIPLDKAVHGEVLVVTLRICGGAAISGKVAPLR